MDQGFATEHDQNIEDVISGFYRMSTTPIAKSDLSVTSLGKYEADDSFISKDDAQGMHSIHSLQYHSINSSIALNGHDEDMVETNGPAHVMLQTEDSSGDIAYTENSQHGTNTSNSPALRTRKPDDMETSDNEGISEIETQVVQGTKTPSAIVHFPFELVEGTADNMAIDDDAFFPNRPTPPSTKRKWHHSSKKGIGAEVQPIMNEANKNKEELTNPPQDGVNEKIFSEDTHNKCQVVTSSVPQSETGNINAVLSEVDSVPSDEDACIRSEESSAPNSTEQWCTTSMANNNHHFLREIPSDEKTCSSNSQMILPPSNSPENTASKSDLPLFPSNGFARSPKRTQTEKPNQCPVSPYENTYPPDEHDQGSDDDGGSDSDDDNDESETESELESIASTVISPTNEHAQKRFPNRKETNNKPNTNVRPPESSVLSPITKEGINAGLFGAKSPLSRTPLAAAWIEKNMGDIFRRETKEDFPEHESNVINGQVSKDAFITPRKITISSCLGRDENSDNCAYDDKESDDEDLASTKCILIQQVTAKEYEGAPRVVKMQVSLQQVESTVTQLNSWWRESGDGDKFVFTEKEAYKVLSNRFSERKSKSILMSLCHWRKLTMQMASDKKGKIFLVPGS